MQKITPFLWFDDNAEEAVDFYVSVFPNSKITSTTRLEDTPGPKGKTVQVNFVLNGVEFIAINGGPGVFTPSGAVSLFVSCENQKEVDYYWDKLTHAGKEIQCGWLTDKFGFTWQVVPTVLSKYLSVRDPIKHKKIMDVFLKMKKIEIKKLEQATEG